MEANENGYVYCTVRWKKMGRRVLKVFLKCVDPETRGTEWRQLGVDMDGSVVDVTPGAPFPKVCSSSVDLKS